MNHSFIAGTESDKCAKCTRDKISHTSLAKCEACPNIGPCEVLGSMLLCETCYAHDIELAAQDSPIPANDRETRISQLTNQLSKEIPLDSMSYFVGEVTAITDIERQLAGIENPNLALAEIVEARLVKFRANLYEVKKLEQELKTNMIMDQKYLNQIVPKLREEEREKFKAYDITYKPTAVVATQKTTSGPRMSASEKAIASMAAMLGITPEAARKSLETATKNVLGVKCTCAETPGICKVHVK